MKVFIILVTTYCAVFAHYNDRLSRPLVRHKRDAVGALDIVTNNAQLIHADVKPENVAEANEKPCPKSYVGDLTPNIESGLVFQVTPPKDAFYEFRSLRKSTPLNSKLDLARSFNRIITLTVLAISAAIEFYPLFQQLYNDLYLFFYV